MSSRAYERAVREYSEAISLCPSGPNSHVYFSNRAAALCYLGEYEAAEEDCLRSVELEPGYEKAHARLGLSRFFVGDYGGSVEAYTRALEIDPGSVASWSYLGKAKARLVEQEREMDMERERDEKEKEAAGNEDMGDDSDAITSFDTHELELQETDTY